MSRFRATAERPTAVNQQTGEVVDIGEVNSRLMALETELAKLNEPLETLAVELSKVTLEYDLRFAASVLASKAGSEDRRKAEALLHMSRATLDDSPVDLLTRKQTLEMQVKSLRTAGHNLRSRISGLQSVASNLRAEMSLGGLRT